MTFEMDRRSFVSNAAKTAASAAAVSAFPRMASAKIIGANDRIRYGIIGAGARGQEDLKTAMACPNTDFVAMADVFTLRTEQVHKFAPKVESYDDHRRLLDRKDVDAIIVASPMHLHAPHFLASLAAGKDLYSEKTMTWSLPEATMCRDAAGKSDRVVQIGMQHESSGSLADIVAWRKAGKLGKVSLVESWMSRNTPHGQGQWVRPIPGDCVPANVRWDEFLMNRPKMAFDANKFINWRLFWEFSGGNVTENMVHQMGLIITAMDLDLPSAAYMSGGVFDEKDGRQVPDTIAVTLDYPEMTVLWQSTFNSMTFGLGERYMGSDGAAEHLWASNDMVTGKSAEQTHFYPEHVNQPKGEAATGTSKNQDHMQNWFDCIRSRAQPNAPVSIGYKAAVAGHMANLSYQQKKRITLQEAMNQSPKY